MTTSIDHHFMQQALSLAEHAAKQDEVPVGAIIVREQEVVGAGWNCPIGTHDPSAHAEMMALRSAGQHLCNYRLLQTTLYVTLEPCPMCLGAMMHARIERLVYATPDPKTGVLGGAYNLLDTYPWNHRLEVTGGVLADESRKLLQQFFANRRKS